MRKCIHFHVCFTGVQGVTLHHLNSPDETPPESVVNRIECYRWYNANADTNISIANTLPECPCDRSKLSFDPLFPEPEAVPDHSDIVCYTIFPSGAFLPHGKVMATFFRLCLH